MLFRRKLVPDEKPDPRIIALGVISQCKWVDARDGVVEQVVHEGAYLVGSATDTDLHFVETEEYKNQPRWFSLAIRTALVGLVKEGILSCDHHTHSSIAYNKFHVERWTNLNEVLLASEQWTKQLHDLVATIMQRDDALFLMRAVELLHGKRIRGAEDEEPAVRCYLRDLGLEDQIPEDITYRGGIVIPPGGTVDVDLTLLG